MLINKLWINFFWNKDESFDIFEYEILMIKKYKEKLIYLWLKSLR